MSTFKKLLALTLALAMVLSVSAFAGYSADTYADADKINGDCEDAIELLYALDIMKGDGKNFNPEASVTRAEMAKMIYVILNYGKDDKAVTYTGAKMFSDVAAGTWYEGYVNYAAATKLVQGRPDGTFGPMDPVTTAEAAKMLLTAIGYSAEARGYTGANWDKNVLSDASIIGLLDGYKANVNTFAPRQWVAVMMENALDALTYKTMAPSFSGLLTSGNADGDTTTMGNKYYGIEIYEGYILAANGYWLAGKESNWVDKDGDWTADFFLYDTSDEEYIGLDGDVTIEDLGQHFKAIVVDGDLVSLRNTGKSVVAEDEVKDVEYDLTYATSSNNYKNVYEFTVGEFTGKVSGGKTTSTLNVLDVVADNDEYETMSSNELKTFLANAETRNDVVRAIDKDGDGDLDYVIYTPVEYATITKTGTSQKYGDYVKADDMNGNALKIESNANLYLDSCILTEDELEVDNFVKFTWNPDEGMYNVEVLPVIESVEFESRKINKDEFTFGGETYAEADNGHKTLHDALIAKSALGDDYDIVVDGDLVVYIVESDSSYNSIDEINEQLAVIIKTDIRNVDDENTKQVKLLTIDGEQAWYTYNVSKAADKDEDNANILTWAEIKGVEDKYGDVDCAEWDQLVIVYTNDDGEVYLEKLVDGEELAIDKDNDYVDYVDIMASADLDADGTPTLDNYRVAGDNKYFAYINKEYTVITVNELEEGEYEDIKATALVADGKYYDTVLGGYLKIGSAAVSEQGILFVTDLDGLEDEDGATITVLFQATGEYDDLYVDSKDAEEYVKGDELIENYAYYYDYDGETWTLTACDDQNEWAELLVEDGDELYVKTGEKTYDEIDATDYDVIALVTQENLREKNDGEWEWETVETIPEFVDAETLAEKLDECEAMLDEDDYTYSFDYWFVEYEDADEDYETLWVVIVKNMVDNADAE